MHPAPKTVPSSAQTASCVKRKHTRRAPHEGTYLKKDGTYDARKKLSRMGAAFDSKAKCWYVPGAVDLEPFEQWLPDETQALDTTPVAFAWQAVLSRKVSAAAPTRAA